MILKTKIVFLTLSISFTSQLFAQKPNPTGVNWPSFRGENSNGISEKFSTPTSWSVEGSKNIKWKTEIPGLGHSSPIVWNDRIFITTAISGMENPDLKVGLYGNIEPVDDETVHQWKVYCLDKKTGKIIWKQTACEGVIFVVRAGPEFELLSANPMNDICMATPAISEGVLFFRTHHYLIAVSGK